MHKIKCFCYVYTILCDCFVSFLSHHSLWSTARFMRSESLIPIWAADQLEILELRDINSFPMYPPPVLPWFPRQQQRDGGQSIGCKISQCTNENAPGSRHKKHTFAHWQIYAWNCFLGRKKKLLSFQTMKYLWVIWKYHSVWIYVHRCTLYFLWVQ